MPPAHITSQSQRTKSLSVATTVAAPWSTCIAVNVALASFLALGASARATTSVDSMTPVPAVTGTANVPHEKPEPLTMAKALAKANRNNPTLCSRRLQQELFEINYDEAWRKMWLPQIGVNLGTNAAYTMMELPGSAAANAGGRQHGSPYSTASLQLGQYNIYNFGRDADTLKSSQLEVDRSRENMHEIERLVRFQVIQAVFNFKTRQDLLDASLRSVESAEAVHDLVKNRLANGRAQRADQTSSNIDLLNARAILLQNQTAYSQALWDLNLVLGDPIGHPYDVKSEVKFIKLRMSLEETLEIYRKNAPVLKDAVMALEQRRAELRLAQKNALPLPTVSFSGLNVGYNFAPQGTQLNRDPGNLNFQVGLNLTIPIVGDGGFLFGRALRTAEVREESAELDVKNAANTNEVRGRVLYTGILQTEATVNLNQNIFKQSAEFFDSALNQLQSKNAFNRLDLKNALEQLRSAELNLTSSVLEHYNLKLQLANLIGVDRFPEENL